MKGWMGLEANISCLKGTQGRMRCAGFMAAKLFQSKNGYPSSIKLERGRFDSVIGL